MKIELYDIVELLEDVNPKIVKGMQGIVIAKYYDKLYELEIVDSNGYTIGFNDQVAFKVTVDQIKRISGGPLQPRR